MIRASSRHLHWIVGAVLLGLAGCVSAAADVTSLSDVGPNEVLLVGKVELVPPLKPGEQQIKVLSPTPMENHVFVFSSTRYDPIEEDFTLAQAEGYINAPFGEPFYVKRPAQPLFLNGVLFYLTMKSNGEQERVFLPAGFRIDIQPKDRAVYIGTIRYHRNEFFEISKMEFVNSLAQETAALRKKFGPDAKLTVRLPVKAAPAQDTSKKGAKRPDSK